MFKDTSAVKRITKRNKLVEALESIKDTMDDSVVIYFGGW